MQVLTHIGGSKCVVELNRPCPDWAVDYIDARRDVRYPNFSFIEVVRNGQVREKHCVHDDNAPEAIIQLMRGYLQ